MALAYTNHGASVASGTAALTSGAITITAVAGDTIIVGISLTVGSAPTVTDSAGNIYTQQVTNSNSSTQWLFTARNGPGAVTSVPVSWTGSSKWSVAICSWSGVM